MGGGGRLTPPRHSPCFRSPERGLALHWPPRPACQLSIWVWLARAGGGRQGSHFSCVRSEPSANPRIRGGRQGWGGPGRLLRPHPAWPRPGAGGAGSSLVRVGCTGRGPRHVALHPLATDSLLRGLSGSCPHTATCSHPPWPFPGMATTCASGSLVLGVSVCRVCVQPVYPVLQPRPAPPLSRASPAQRPAPC